MRIVTRPDFDGVVCAALLSNVLDITEPTCWITADKIQRGEWQAKEGDIIANLPYHPKCTLWFDHHASNQIEEEFEGTFEVAPSAARVIFEYYKDQFSYDYLQLVEATDRIDSAQLTKDEVKDPESNLYFLLSVSLEIQYNCGTPYWDKVLGLLESQAIEKILKEPEVRKCCDDVLNTNANFTDNLLKCTIMHGQVSLTDFRGIDKTPNGNRFLVYCLFPECITNVKLCHSDTEPNITRCSIGHNIFKRECEVSAGKLLSRYQGGGHFGAGGASLEKAKADEIVQEIIKVLSENKPI